MIQPPLFEDRPLFEAQTAENQLFLSRLILNPRSRQVRRDIANSRELHRTIMKGFGQHSDKNAREQFGVLFRLDVNERQNTINLLVQSAARPDWDCLPADYLAQTEAANLSVRDDLAEKYANLENGVELMFRLRANPTKRLYAEVEAKERNPKKRGNRVALFKEAEQIAWLRQKSENGGFRLVEVQIRQAAPNNKIVVRRAKDETPTNVSADMTFTAILFEGTLQITDAARFKQSLADGIGQGKAYGFGLLSVARPLSF